MNARATAPRSNVIVIQADGECPNVDAAGRLTAVASDAATGEAAV